MKLTDEIVLAKIKNQTKILIVDLENSFNNNLKALANDLKGNSYNLDCDLAGYNSKKHKTYFDYYLGDEYLKPLQSNKQIMKKFKLSADCEINKNQLKQIENSLNNNQSFEI